MTNGEKHIEKLLSWYQEAVTEDGVSYLTSDDKNTLAYALKCCKHFEDIKKDNDSWIQDQYDKRILSRRYGNVFDCNNCGRSWIACKDDILEGYELDVKLRCPYCHNMITIPRNFNWY